VQIADAGVERARDGVKARVVRLAVWRDQPRRLQVAWVEFL
jgi:hypothetical protein